MNTHKIAVLGSDVLTLAVAGQMAARGAQVVQIDPLSQTCPPSGPRQVHITGAVTADAILAGTTNDISAISDADIVVISIAPSLRDTLYPKVAPYLRSGQHLLFFTASYGALTFWNRFSDSIPAGVTLSEAVSYPCVCETTGPDTLRVFDVKRSMELAVMPASRTAELLALYNAYFDAFKPVRNCLYASMNNINMMLHPLPILVNLGAVERDTANFHHFVDGVSPRVGTLLERSDQERLAVGKAMGFSLASVMEQLTAFYGGCASSGIEAYVTAADGPYADVKGYGADCRYVTEDVPYLLVAVEALGKAVKVPTPVITLTVDLACAVNGTDYRKIGYTLDKLGMENMDVSKMIDMAERIAG